MAGLRFANSNQQERPFYRIIVGSLQDRFLKLRSKIQMYGGGFGNGKTSCGCYKALEIMRDYPGSHGAVLRETCPKVEGTTMKEFFKWCPPGWIESFNQSTRFLRLKNGSTCVFGYIAQQGDSNSSTSNVLSATFDWALIDQVEDPGIVYKDFTDLLGRLRGSAPYKGSDPTMPKTGPRWLMLLCNPTRNWVYKKLVQPLQLYKATGQVTQDLLINPETKQLLLEIVEGSTLDNKDNLPADFYETMELTYKGQMKDRFLGGQWAGYEGLVYPAFDMNNHVIPHEWLVDHYFKLLETHKVTVFEGYDYGLAVPSAYGLFFRDDKGNIFLLDGYYEKEKTLDYVAEQIKAIRLKYNVPYNNIITADPAIFKRTIPNGTKAESIADKFLKDHNLFMTAGQNDINTGILKITGFLEPMKMHQHPMTGEYNAPHFFVSDKCNWFVDEITDYYWAKDKNDDSKDVPSDKNDHALDMTKYALTFTPSIATLYTTIPTSTDHLNKWSEMEEENED